MLLSVRDTDEWWNSARNTIFEVVEHGVPGEDPVGRAQLQMATDMLRTQFTPDWIDEGAAKAAYDRHNDRVRALVPSERLVEWSPGQGWDPICSAIGLAVPDTAFPHVNTTEEFRAMVGLDGRP